MFQNILPIVLPFPVFLKQQIQEILAKTQLSEPDLYKIDTPATIHDKILQICREHDLDIKPITNITIPDNIESQMSRLEEEDITILLNNVKTTIDSYERISKLNPPTTILNIKELNVISSINTLENNPNEYRDERDRHIYRSLNDIGYSLQKGWLFKDYPEKEAV